MAYAALASLAQTINQILNHHRNPITLPVVIQEIITSIRNKATDLQSFLEDFPVKASSLEGQIREVANKAEDVIEYLLCEKNASDYGSTNIEIERQLKQVAEKFMSTAGDVADYVRENDSVNEGQRQRRAPTNFDGLIKSKFRRTGADVVVGFGNSVYGIRQQLIDSTQLHVFPIVRMGGSGKTTLAKLIYTDPLISKVFGIRCWVTVSQDYSIGSIVSNLLASLKGIRAYRDVQSKMAGEDEIRSYLMGGRYLIVMDHMWSKKAWDDVRMLFPDNNNGSCIIITTRLQDVAAYASPSRPFHKVHSLSEDQSWTLLRYKVFRNLQCPSEMECAGREIAEKCGGLPLYIVLVAGLLSKIDKSYHVWKQIAESDVQLETIISLSYIHLPHHVKSRFLYMGGFPEDYEIRASELIKLWAAEGLLKRRNGSKSLEEDGEDCLRDLIERSLVLLLLWITYQLLF